MLGATGAAKIGWARRDCTAIEDTEATPVTVHSNSATQLSGFTSINVAIFPPDSQLHSERAHRQRSCQQPSIPTVRTSHGGPRGQSESHRRGTFGEAGQRGGEARGVDRTLHGGPAKRGRKGHQEVFQEMIRQGGEHHEKE
ncbi:hypothetical protein Naga_100118g17 [Nannochloropsis gaditana]|uniref:Uncharacterized protein n=1 Tax=Nannochloropsis gaditana TaxID=72520 RepID=W7T777_9STRA|nr:hypothetical protein Naga_100118g17 [Nannochloropsis gaditana]